MPAYRLYTLADADARALEAGATSALDLAVRYDVSESTVYRAARRAGIRLSKGQTYARSRREQHTRIARAVEHCPSTPLRFVAERYGVSKRTVLRILARARRGDLATA